MVEERRDNNIFVLGLLLAAALAFYGLWTEEVPIVVELVELVKNNVVKYLEPKTITRIDKQIVYLTATPGPSVNELIYYYALGYSSPVVIADPAITEAEKEAILRSLTEVPLTPSPSPTWTLVPPQAPSTMPTMPPTEVPATQVPAPATQAPAPATQVPAPATQAPAPATQVPAPATQVPAPATQVPAPATQAPPPPPAPPTWTPAPPTWTPAPPTWTPAPPTWTPVPPTWTPVPTLVPTASYLESEAGPQLVAPDLLNSQEGNPELAPTSGMATINGKINSEEDMTMILIGGDYYASIEAIGGQFSFDNVPNGTYNLSANTSGPGAGCAEITVSVPEGHATLTYNYRFYKMQCFSE